MPLELRIVVWMAPGYHYIPAPALCSILEPNNDLVLNALSSTTHITHTEDCECRGNNYGMFCIHSRSIRSLTALPFGLVFSSAPHHCSVGMPLIF
jgi:hypothetical protein